MNLQPIYTNADFKIVPFRAIFKIPDPYQYETKPCYSVFSLDSVIHIGKFRLLTWHNREADYLTYEEAIAHVEHLTQTKWED